MAEGLAPVDEYGMPYAYIVPNKVPNKRADETLTEHHVFYRRKARQLKGLAGRTMRISRVHDQPRWFHNLIHSRFSLGLERFPETNQQKFGLTVLSCAGYLSRDGLRLMPDKTFELTPMSTAEYEAARSRRVMHPQTEDNGRVREEGARRRTQDAARRDIAEFFTVYALRQDLSHIDQRLIEELLETDNTFRKFEIGRVILDEAAHVAVEPISGIYKEALGNGLLRTEEPDPATVITRLPAVGNWETHIDVMARRLAA